MDPSTVSPGETVENASGESLSVEHGENPPANRRWAAAKKKMEAPSRDASLRRHPHDADGETGSDVLHAGDANRRVPGDVRRWSVMTGRDDPLSKRTAIRAFAANHEGEFTDPSRDAGVIAAFGNRIVEKETEVGFGMIRYFQGSLALKRDSGRSGRRSEEGSLSSKGATRKDEPARPVSPVSSKAPSALHPRSF